MCLGIPGQIVEITDVVRKLALVDVSGVRRAVNIACVAEQGSELQSCVGQWVLVHVGFAMARIDAVEAQKTLDLLNELSEARAEFAALGGSLPEASSSAGGSPAASSPAASSPAALS